MSLLKLLNKSAGCSDMCGVSAFVLLLFIIIIIITLA